MRQSERRFATHPRRPYDRLPYILVFLPALRPFMLHAPLADLLPKCQRRQLPSALNAVRHAIKRLSAVGRDAELEAFSRTRPGMTLQRIGPVLGSYQGMPSGMPL